MSERTLVGTDTFELMKVQLASRMFDGLLGPRKWVDTNQPNEKDVIPREPLLDTRLTEIFQGDLVFELAAHGAFLLVGLTFFAAFLNEVGRVRCNDGDIIERPKVHIVSTTFHVVYIELVNFYITFKLPIVSAILLCLRCCGKGDWWKPVKQPREALSQILHHPVTKDMARTLSRCPGPMQARKSSDKEQALHFGCTNMEDLEDCVAVFAKSMREARTIAECIKVAVPAYYSGRHAQRGGFLAGVLAETYCPPPGLIVGAEIRSMTYTSQRVSRQLRKVRLDQYELRDFCSRMAEGYNRLESTQTKITEAINAHMAEVARLENVNKFQQLMKQKAAEEREAKKKEKKS
jgi:hypothetical protein